VVLQKYSKTHGKRLLLLRRATVALIVITAWFLVSWQAASLLVVSQPLAQADAIVVLSGSGTFRERAQHAAKLFSEGRSKKIILTNDNEQSSWSSAEQRNPNYWERAYDELLRARVEQQAILVLSTPVSSTYEEAALLKNYAENNGLRSLLIVTSAYHSRRALWTFRHIFQGSRIEVGLDPVRTGIQTPLPEFWWLSIRGWKMVPSEYCKIILYWFWLR
jgi:uncharacterized SAM-binding protein YcdF (DUF218 family)